MKYIVSLILAAVMSSAVVAAANEPENLAFVKKHLEYYHDYAYLPTIAHKIQKAKNFLAKRIAQNKAKATPVQLAIVLDIDETSLSNYPSMLKESFGGDMHLLDELDLKAEDPAIKSTLDLYQYAINHGVKVFFITGRHEWLRAATVKNLKQQGYHGWKHLFMKPNRAHFKQVRYFKAPIRCAIENQHYDIVLNIGDQFSDLQGGCADLAIKLPDPFYYLP